MELALQKSFNYFKNMTQNSFDQMKQSIINTL